VAADELVKSWIGEHVDHLVGVLGTQRDQQQALSGDGGRGEGAHAAASSSCPAAARTTTSPRSDG
jgi:hypothetical protein